MIRLYVNLSRVLEDRVILEVNGLSMKYRIPRYVRRLISRAQEVGVETLFYIQTRVWKYDSCACRFYE